MGLSESAAKFFPDGAWQRCVVHWCRTIFNHVPSTKVREIAAMLAASPNYLCERFCTSSPFLAADKDDQSFAGNFIYLSSITFELTTIDSAFLREPVDVDGLSVGHSYAQYFKR
jgi:hypothetical protein